MESSFVKKVELRVDSPYWSPSLLPWGCVIDNTDCGSLLPADGVSVTP